MRIAGGRLKGRRIAIPAGSNFRPSTEKLREAIFSVIGGDIIGAKVADFFCGSGALGIEALSRGAEYALFIDSSRFYISNLRKNLRNLDLLGQSDLKAMNALNVRAEMVGDLSIIFADPPYRQGFADGIISLLCLPKFDWYGILVLEHEPQWNLEGRKMEVLGRKVHGDRAASFLRKVR